MVKYCLEIINKITNAHHPQVFISYLYFPVCLTWFEILIIDQIITSNFWITFSPYLIGFLLKEYISFYTKICDNFQYNIPNSAGTIKYTVSLTLHSKSGSRYLLVSVCLTSISLSIFFLFLTFNSSKTLYFYYY